MATLLSAGSRDGTALVTVTVMSLALAVMAASVTQLAIARNRDQQRQEVDFLVSMSAESAAAMAVSYLQDNPTELPKQADGLQTFVPLRNGKPVTSINGLSLVYDRICLSDAAKKWRIRVQATYGARGNANGDADTYRRRSVEEVIQQKSYQAGLAGMFSIAGYAFKGSGNAGSFDSNPLVNGPNETLAMSDPKGPMVLATAAASGVDVQKAGSVVGQYGTLQLPSPTLVWNPNPVVASGVLKANVTLAPGSYHYTSWDAGIITIPSDGTVTVWVDGNVDFGSIGVIYSTANSKLKVWQTNAATLDTDSTKLNGNKYLGDIAHPERFQFFSNTHGTIALNGNAQMGAVIIAPYASLMIRGTFDFYGAIFVNAMTSDKATGNPSFMYDRNLADMTIDELSSLAVSAWHVQDIGYGSYRYGDKTLVGTY
jgi:hypothetical protein